MLSDVFIKIKLKLINQQCVANINDVRDIIMRGFFFFLYQINSSAHKCKPAITEHWPTYKLLCLPRKENRSCGFKR